jgi:hypothetical protein
VVIISAKSVFLRSKEIRKREVILSNLIAETAILKMSSICPFMMRIIMFKLSNIQLKGSRRNQLKVTHSSVKIMKIKKYKDFAILIMSSAALTVSLTIVII